MTPTPAIGLEHVHKVYAGPPPVPAVNDVSLLIAPGTSTTIEGPSGSGKTTLLSLIGGLDSPTRGRLTVLGTNLTRLDARSLLAFRRAKVGFVFQDFKLVDVLTAIENVALPLRIRGVRRREATARSRRALAELGLGARLEARPGELSGGEKQRVAIARAVVTDPGVLLADEPTANLDSAAGAEVIRVLREMAHWQGKTVVVVSHDPRVARGADEVVHLLDGRLVDHRVPEIVP